MNVNIKKILIILILSSYFISSIFSKELVITIPKQFNRSELPLPPFPKEVVKELEITDYTKEILNSVNVRFLPQERIKYKYFSNIVDYSYSKKLYLDHIAGLHTDFNRLNVSYSSELYNNNYFIDGEVFLSLNPNNYNLSLSYKEFRLPMDIQTKVDKDKEELSGSLTYNSYNTKFELTDTYSLANNDINLNYFDNRFLRPFVELEYLKGNLNGIIALGYNYNIGDFRIGPLKFYNMYLGYVDLNLSHNNLLLNIDTELNIEDLDYLIEFGYKKNHYVKFGTGITLINSDSSINPYLSLRDNYFWGERELQVYKERIKAYLKFAIKDTYTNLGIDIYKLNELTMLVENKASHHKVTGSVTYKREENNFSGKIEIEFKVGKL